MVPAEDPNWPRADGWLAGDHLPNPEGVLAIIGAGLNHSISLGSTNKAPDAIRACLHRLSTYCFDLDLDVRRLAVEDKGNLSLSDLNPEAAFTPISSALSDALTGADAAILLGGDNGITRAGCHGLDLPLQNIGLITIDAHLDLRDTEGGLHNGNPVRQLLADGLPGNQIIQIGIQSFANSRTYAEVAKAHGISVVSCENVHKQGLSKVITESLGELGSRVEAIYVDVDVDVLDRAFAPATPGSRPGGLMPWQLRQAVRLCGLSPKVRALDLVEVDPDKDVADCTCFIAAECMLSFASGLLARRLTQL